MASCPPEGPCPGWLPTEGTQRPRESKGSGSGLGGSCRESRAATGRRPDCSGRYGGSPRPQHQDCCPIPGGQSQSSPHLICVLTGRGDTVGKTAIKSTFPGSVPGSDCQIPGCLEESTAGCGDSMGSTWRWGDSRAHRFLVRVSQEEEHPLHPQTPQGTSVI